MQLRLNSCFYLTKAKGVKKWKPNEVKQADWPISRR